jgi:hypothetical protein
MRTVGYDVCDGRVFMGPQVLTMPRADKRAALAGMGVTMVVNLWWRRDDDIAALVDSYHHVPVPDGKLSDGHLAHFDVLARVSARHLDEGGVVLTQCQGGRNRSGVVAALTLCYWLGISGDEALDRVRSGRGPVAVGNRHFSRWLASIPASSSGGSVPS